MVSSLGLETFLIFIELSDVIFAVDSIPAIMFIGTKMLMSAYYHIPIAVTMSVIFSVLAISIAVSRE